MSWRPEFLKLFCVFGLLQGCGDSRSVQLIYSVENSSPDLVFTVRLEERQSGASSQYRFVPNLETSSFSNAYDQLAFGAELIGCAQQLQLDTTSALPSASGFLGGSCEGLGQYVEEVLFGGQTVTLDRPSEAAEPRLEITADTEFLFVLFAYNASQNQSPRCLQLQLFQVQNSQIILPSEGLARNSITLELEEPQIGVNCFAIFS